AGQVRPGLRGVLPAEPAERGAGVVSAPLLPAPEERRPPAGGEAGEAVAGVVTAPGAEGAGQSTVPVRERAGSGGGVGVRVHRASRAGGSVEGGRGLRTRS